MTTKIERRIVESAAIIAANVFFAVFAAWQHSMLIAGMCGVTSVLVAFGSMRLVLVSVRIDAIDERIAQYRALTKPSERTLQ